MILPSTSKIVTHTCFKQNNRKRKRDTPSLHALSFYSSFSFRGEKETNKSEKERQKEITRDERGGIIDNIQIIKMYDKEL